MPTVVVTRVTSIALLRAKIVGTRHAITLGMAKSVFVEDAAQLLGVSRRTVYYRIREGRLQTVRTANGTRRVLMESIEALLREGSEVTVPGADVSGTDPSAKSPAI
jgi:excisionase family DNA binding protein